MNNARARYIQNLEQSVSSMVAQIEVKTPNDDSGSSCSRNDEQQAGSMMMEAPTPTPKVEEYSAANTYLQTPDGGFQCTYPGCVVKTIFDSQIKFEDHQLQHFPEKFPCLACDQVFERTESHRRHKHDGN